MEQIRLLDDAPEIQEPLAALRSEFEGRPHELIPMLQRVQRALGYLPEPALAEIARLTGLPAATVFGVATFYAQFRFQAVGRHVIRICRGTACHVRGSDRILEDLKTRLKISPGGTTEDGLFTLETVACFGSCALAPVVVADDSVQGRMNPSKTRKILKDLAGEAEAAAGEEA